MDAAVTGWKPEGVAAGGFIHLINSGATTMDAAGKPVMKPFWELTPPGSRRLPRRRRLAPRRPRLLPRHGCRWFVPRLTGPFKDVYSVMAAWGAFGMEAEGSDYRACEALGPLYGKR